MKTAYFGGGLVITEENGVLTAEWHKTDKIMKVGKIINEEMLLIECENNKEVSGERTLEELYALDYKDVCEVARPSETATLTYQKFDTCFVQVWQEQEEQSDEITDSEALQIITQGE